MTPTEAARLLRGWAGTYRICDPPDACPDCIRTIKAVRMGAEALEREAAAEGAEPLPIGGPASPSYTRGCAWVGGAHEHGSDAAEARRKLAARLRATARALGLPASVVVMAGGKP